MNFIYPPHVVSREDKLKYEAEQALLILSDKSNVQIIIKVTKSIIKVLEKNKDIKSCDISEFGAFYNSARTSNLFPTHTKVKNVSEKKDLVKMLKKQASSKEKDAIIAILTVIWILPKYLLSAVDQKRKEEISSVYSSFDRYGRNHSTMNLEVKKQTLMAKNLFGSAQIKSQLLNNLNPLYQLSSHYVENNVNALSTRSIYTRNKMEGVPYLAGTSGMANGFCNTLSLLNIGISSSEGQKLENIMSAFIVGIGFHSFQECYDAFDMTDKYTDMIEVMMDMGDHVVI